MFKEGQKVVCIADFEWYSDLDGEMHDGPKYDEILKIDGFDENGHLLFFKYDLVEGYYEQYFKPLELDYSFVEEVIKQVQPQPETV